MRVQDIDTGLQDLERELFSAMMDPDPARPDWAERRPRLITMCDKALTLFTALERAQSLLGAKERESWTRRAGEVANQLVGLLHAAGETEAKATMIRAGLRVALVGPPQDELEAARRAPDLHLALARARWLHDRERHAEARAQLDKVIAGDEAILVDAAELVEAVEPPALKTWRGCGHGLFGRHDERPDRSYLTTRCFQLFGVPVWPRARYRVRKTREGLFFMGRLPISPAARWTRRLAVTGLVALAAAVGLWFWLDRTTRRLEQALAAAARVERSGPPEAAEQRYLEVATRFRKRVSGRALAPVASALVRIELARSRPPGSPSALAALELLVMRLNGLPRDAWAAGAGAGSRLAQHLEKVASDLEARGEAGVDGALGLLDHAATFATPRDATRLRQHRDELRRRRVEALADDWPLLAIERLGDAGDETTARTRQGELLLRVAQTPGLISEVEPAARDFLRWAALSSERAQTARKVEAALESAGVLAMDAARNRALESGDPEALAAALRAHPADQAIQAGLASALAATDRPAALARLDKLGRPGWLVGTARMALIAAVIGAGDLARADDLLGHEVSFRLPHFRAAVQAYDTGYRKLAKQLGERAEHDQLPRELTDHFQGQPLEVQQRLYSEWLERTLDQDTELTLLRDRARREAVVVDLALQLGTLELQRASTAAPAQRGALLESAERAFLAIAGEADERPEYHLGLGQAYYRLGRTADARREFDSLLSGASPERELDVARAYRNVGMLARAREIALQTSKGAEPARTAAALLLSAMADTPDQRASFLALADPNLAEVKRELARVKADLALRAGRMEEADALFAAAIEDGRKHPASVYLLNDESIALGKRFAATGDARFLDESAAAIDRAQKLVPDDATLLGNQIDILQHRAAVGVLAGRVAVPRLRLTRGLADGVITALLSGPQQSAVLATLLREPAQQRVTTLVRRLQTLTPYSPRSYELEVEDAVLRKDLAALTALSGRLQGQELDRSEIEEWRIAWRRGDHDLALREDARSILATHRAVVTDRDAATAATAQLVVATQLRLLAMLDRDPALARESLAALRAAAAGWSALGLERDIAWELLQQLLLETTVADPAVAALFEREYRDYSEAQLIAHLPEATRAALARRPEAVEALSLLRAAATRDPRATDWLVAHALGDQELERLALPALDDPLRRLERELAARIDPGSRAAAELAALKP